MHTIFATISMHFSRKSNPILDDTKDPITIMPSYVTIGTLLWYCPVHNLVFNGFLFIYIVTSRFFRQHELSILSLLVRFIYFHKRLWVYGHYVLRLLYQHTQLNLQTTATTCWFQNYQDQSVRDIVMLFLSLHFSIHLEVSWDLLIQTL